MNIGLLSTHSRFKQPFLSTDNGVLLVQMITCQKNLLLFMASTISRCKKVDFYLYKTSRTTLYLFSFSPVDLLKN